jgi:hypothetical protein
VLLIARLEFEDSRKEQDIESSLLVIVDPKHAICLQSQIVDKDIRKFVHQRLSDDKSLKKWHKSTDIRQEIETTLIQGAHGMYTSHYSDKRD